MEKDMKIRCFVIMLVVIWGVTGIILPALAEEIQPELSVKVQEDGSVAVQCFLQETEYDTVNIYKHGEVITPDEKTNPLPLIWWVAWNRRSVTYPGINEYQVYAKDRASELSNGADSALPPGKYYAVILGENNTHLTEPVEFEILDKSSQVIATPAIPTPPTATASSIISATATPTVKTFGTDLPPVTKSPSMEGPTAAMTVQTERTAKPTGMATAANRTGPTSTTLSSDPPSRNSRKALWIGISAGAAVIAAAVIFIWIWRKKKRV